MEFHSTRANSEKRHAKRNRYRRNRRTRNLLARADSSFILDINQFNTNLPITKIFLNNIQEDSRDALFLSPGTLPPSYSPIYDVEPDPLSLILYL